MEPPFLVSGLTSSLREARQVAQATAIAAYRDIIRRMVRVAFPLVAAERRRFYDTVTKLEMAAAESWPRAPPASP